MTDEPEGLGTDYFSRVMKEPTIPTVIEEGYVVIKVKPGYDYNIEFSRIDTPEKILLWVYHLGEKTWFDQEALRHFIAAASKRINFDLDRGV